MDDNNKLCNCRTCNGIVHKVKKGDTLYLLSRYYNVSVSDIIRENRAVNPYNLMVGDTLCIPLRNYVDYTERYNYNSGMNNGGMGNAGKIYKQKYKNSTAP